jgi:hypothetical protein
MLINTRTYNVDRVQPDAVQYTGPANTITLKDRFEMKRAYPKASGTYLGVAKPQAKLTKTVTVNAVTGAVADRILNIGGSVPVGTSDADIAMLADGAAFLASSEALALFKALDVNA